LELVHLVVPGEDAAGELRALAHEGVQALAGHPLRDLRHPGNVGQGLDGWMGQHPHRLLGDVHRLVTDALEVGVDLHGGGDQPQVGGHRLLESEQAQAAVVDLDLHLVHLLVRGDDPLDGVGPPLDQGARGRVHPLLDERPHVQEPALERLQLRLEMVFFRSPLAARRQRRPPKRTVPRCTRPSGVSRG